MSRDYLNKKPIYFLNKDGTNPVTDREPIELAFLKIKIGFAGVTAILMMILVLFSIVIMSFIMALA